MTRATSRTLRAGVVGARRVRQGTGPFAARFLHEAGVRVTGVAGTSHATAEQAARELAEKGVAAAPYASAEAMLAAGDLDLLVIASPEASHGAILRAALDARVHVLCEKPFLPGRPEDVEEARRLVAGFAAAKRLLAVAAQWKHALPAYMRLFPAVAPRAATRFSMRSSPAEPGPSMLPVAMPHAFAVLDHLYGASDAPLYDLVVEAPSPGRMRVAFRHPGGAHGVACEVVLEAGAPPPRPFSIGFDGAVAAREVEPATYAMRLVDPASGRAVPLPDPYEALVKDVVARARRGPPFPPDPTIASGVARLAQTLAVLGRG